MADQLPIANLDSWKLASCLDDCAKWWWGLSLILKGVAFVIGGIAVICSWNSASIPVIVAAVGIASEGAIYRSDMIRGLANGLRRKLDLQDSFGWPISQGEYSDLVVRSPRSVKQGACMTGGGAYYASTQPPGPRRAVENVMESAWWSKHLCEKLTVYCFLAMLIAMLLSLLVLAVAVLAAASAETGTLVVRLVTGFVMFTISLGLIKLTSGYFGFAKKAGRCDEAAERLLDKPEVTFEDAIKLVGDYHVARAGSPVIPTKVWEWNEKELNQTWKAHRVGNSPNSAGAPAASVSNRP